MIKQGLNSILEKKFKILRTSIMLGNIKNRDEVLTTYEETAREIDKAKREVYEELLASKIYTTTTLEDEQVRLKNLIDFIEKRIRERNDFIDDYIKVTSNFLDDLPKVSLENELPNYKARLDNIDEYINNSHEIEKQNDKLVKLRKELEEKYENKNNSEIINSKLEDELIEAFNNIINKNEYYSNLSYTDIDNELVKIENSLNEKKEIMNTFVSSYEALKNAGITGAEREEYLSYVEDAKNDYYSDIEKKYILSIYKLVLDKQTNYDMLYQKRLDIDNLLKERDKYRVDLNISVRDELSYFINLCEEQFSVIKSQKFNIENIDKLVLAIADCENKIETLKEANNRDEIVSLLNEYALNKTLNEQTNLVDDGKEEIIDNNVVNTIIDNNDLKFVPKPGNMVVEIKDPIKINVKDATDVAKLVMKKVVIVLEPKRFNKKRDKLKEADQEIALEKEEKKKQEDNFIDLDIPPKTEDKKDDIFIDKVVPIGEVKEEKKIVIPNEMESIPTEIFIEEEKEEKQPDLFNQTDPFLDDNQFELDDSSSNSDSVISNMPKINNIGTVKPTSMLSTIENVTKENDNIILPTMGLTDNKVDVPIVSENYIN